MVTLIQIPHLVNMLFMTGNDMIELLSTIGYIVLLTSVIGVLYVFGKVLWSGIKTIKQNDD